MRVLIFHGYLLGGTGSNVYNASLARALAALGHEVHLLCQERDPLLLPWVDAAGDWDAGGLRMRRRSGGAPGGGGDRGAGGRAGAAAITVYRPAIGRVLPVYVRDVYAGFDAKPFAELGDAELEAYIEANVTAVREVAERVRPDRALANHLVMGPEIVRRALGDAVGYAVKIHGSALEYTVKPDVERFGPFAAAGLGGASGVLVGSRHTAESLWAALEPEVGGLRERTRLGPPGVDVGRFAPRAPADARAAMLALAGRLADAPADPADDPSSFARDPAEAARALRAVEPGDRLVLYVGKLIASKGVELLLAAWPSVVARVPRARLVLVGFGAFRPALERLAAALARGDADAARAIATAGRGLEGGPDAELSELARWLSAGATRAGRNAGHPAPGAPGGRTPTGGEDGLPAGRTGDASASGAFARVHFAGRLEHEELEDLIPAADALVMPSTFPEAFGMVAAEAAACGTLPLVARHSGMAEVAMSLEAAVGGPARQWLAFGLGEEEPAVAQIADRLASWLTAPEEVRDDVRRAIVQVARERYSWEGVARTVLAAAGGALDDLPPVPPAAPRPATAT